MPGATTLQCVGGVFFLCRVLHKWLDVAEVRKAAAEGGAHVQEYVLEGFFRLLQLVSEFIRCLQCKQGESLCKS